MLPAAAASPNYSPTFTVIRGQKSQAKMVYGGTFFANCFQVNKPIELIAVAFFGPADGILSNYWVKIDVFESTKVYPDPSIRVGKLRMEANVSSELFWIKFRQPIRMKPNTWYTVQFCLDDGPNTFRCEKTQNDITVPVGLHGEKIEFNFLEGSMQMPQMQFKLAYGNLDENEKSLDETKTTGFVSQILGSTRTRNWGRTTTAASSTSATTSTSISMEFSELLKLKQ